MKDVPEIEITMTKGKIEVIGVNGDIGVLWIIATIKK
jgi:hypothetical protein